MGSHQIAEIRPAVKEALEGGAPWCVTFEITGDPDRWVQFTDNTINAYYPHPDEPGVRLGSLTSFTLTEWAPNKYLTGNLADRDASSIAQWIDQYFAQVLGCDWDYSVDWRIERLK